MPAPGLCKNPYLVQFCTKRWTSFKGFFFFPPRLSLQPKSYKKFKSHKGSLVIFNEASDYRIVCFPISQLICDFLWNMINQMSRKKSSRLSETLYTRCTVLFNMISGRVFPIKKKKRNLCFFALNTDRDSLPDFAVACRLYLLKSYITVALCGS